MAQFFLQTIWAVPLYALIGAVLTIPWSPGIIRNTGPRPAGYINLLMTFIAFVHSLVAIPATWHQPAKQIIIPWLQVANLDISLPLEISTITVGAMLLVTGMNLLAQIYAVGYMEMDWGWARFYALLALFECGMCALALCNSLFFSYVILEILTLGTYLLVGLWFSQPLVVTGARDAFLTKRVGDLVLLMGVIALLSLTGTWNYWELGDWAATAHPDPKVITLISLALIAGPMGKCAQFPLHLWLDEAMEGPLPSTILRNSVVVATGAWVLIKLEPILSLSPITMSALVLIGSVTAVGASCIAASQIDIKRALSYSVSAYMGLVFIAVGTGQNDAALLLVLTHAVAMGLLIMSAGGIIWNNITQDLTQMGGLWSRRPISALAFLGGTAALIGCPPFGSFWALLNLADTLWITQPWLVGIVLLVNALTAFSLVRIFSLIFGGKPKQMTVRSPEAMWLLVLPMMLLLGFTLHLPLVLESVSLLPNWGNLNKDVAILLFLSSVFGCTIAGVIYLGNALPKPVQLPSKALQNLFAYDFYTPDIYRFTIVFAVDRVSKIVAWVDRFIVDGAVNLVGLASLLGGESLKYSTSGQSQFYALTILIGIGIIGAFLSFPHWSAYNNVFNLGL
ncbi:NAD(P)H-quinone oxidoreductase subunit F [Synechocystis sp. PCC 7509]|uniref:NAD(P)H-quinone oxidoreductase subunit F n=1 Tax=Synechocystis sp. PCC 7509 TaxID=927677 RepID=UPI0002AC9565|nr:NAD(P)H-quinone oxidoreductase subunit F [Synechocystis sp. PCC 7509]